MVILWHSLLFYVQKVKSSQYFALHLCKVWLSLTMFDENSTKAKWKALNRGLTHEVGMERPA